MFTAVPTKDTEILLLQAAIQIMHQCEVVHERTVFVDQKFQGKTIWMGYVQVFRLSGCLKATSCFAWWHQEEGKNARPVVMLERWPVNSPETAVGAAVTFDVPGHSVHFDLAQVGAH